jgi:hypothetical protein
MTHFNFETDFIESLRCIPMQVRYQLDTCGIKLKLQQWHQFSDRDRQMLVEMPCESEAEIQTYRDFLSNLICDRTGDRAKELPINPHPPWMEIDRLPPDVLEKANACDVTLTLEQWANLTPLQRFVLIKLSRPSHENKNFVPALEEFGLTQA